MQSEWIIPLIEGGVPIFGGFLSGAIAYGMIPMKPGLNLELYARNQKTLRWASPLLIIFGVFNFWHTHEQTARPSAEAAVQQMAGQLRLPMKIDEHTQLVGVSGKGNTITYSYDTDFAFEGVEQIAEAEKKLHEDLRRETCSRKEGLLMLDAGYDIEKMYRFVDGGARLSAKVSRASCG